MRTKSIKNCIATLFTTLAVCNATANDSICYRLEAAWALSEGNYAPTWLAANRYGMSSEQTSNGYLRAGGSWSHDLKRGWRIGAGIDIAGGINMASKVWIQQAYADITWRMLNLSIGSKERSGFPLDKNEALTSGWMVEGINARPIPQIRAEMKDFWTIPGTKGWLAFKGHVAYGYFTDGCWQQDFVAPGKQFTRNVLLHSKSLMARVGNRQIFPLEFEVSLTDAAQFAGDRMKKNDDGSISLIRDMPDGFRSLLKAFIPKQSSTLQNIEGNHCGSWSGAITAYPGDWRVRVYLEHYFEDHSQMFFQYGRWKDGHIGFEINPPKNRWISAFVWEGMSTHDQTGPVLYDGVAGSFNDLQMSGNDHYYNNWEYLGWQNYGATLGHPFLYGPQYSPDNANEIRSSRVKLQHIGISGEPTAEWKWRLLFTYSRQWGTYYTPLDKVRCQAAGLAEATYSPKKAKGWSLTGSFGLDRGNYLGNSVGGMITIRKTGIIKL